MTILAMAQEYAGLEQIVLAYLQNKYILARQSHDH
jgi:hypothetical protein